MNSKENSRFAGLFGMRPFRPDMRHCTIICLSCNTQACQLIRLASNCPVAVPAFAKLTIPATFQYTTAILRCHHRQQLSILTPGGLENPTLSGHRFMRGNDMHGQRHDPAHQLAASAA